MKTFKPQRTVCIHCRRRIFRREERAVEYGFAYCTTCTRECGIKVGAGVERDPAKWGGHTYREPAPITNETVITIPKSVVKVTFLGDASVLL